MKKKLINQLLEIIGDYNMPKGMEMKKDHVDRWINQFDEEFQNTILEELIEVFSKQYLSKDIVKSKIRSVLTDKKIWGENIKESIQNTNFLKIQEQGNSQKDLLEIVDEILFEEYEIKIKNCFSKNKYFYIDDCIFTGNRFINDIKRCIESGEIKEGSIFISYHLAYYKSGWNHAVRKISQMFKKIKVEAEYWYHYMFQNYQKNLYKNDLSVLWPKEIEYEQLSSYIDWRCNESDYAKNVDFCRNYNMINENLFKDSSGRDIIESQFLKVGLDLVINANNPSASIRPMGFSKLESIGFGAMFVTYRNISNNCPLALWYGDVTCSSNKALTKWYPLFPRTCAESIEPIGIVDFKEIWEFI